MPSSISSSEIRADRYARETAADRPGVAQPVPVRPVPEQPWGKILFGVTSCSSYCSWQVGSRIGAAMTSSRASKYLRPVGNPAPADRYGQGKCDRAGGRFARVLRHPVARLGAARRQRPIQLSFEGRRRWRIWRISRRTRSSSAACWSESNPTCSLGIRISRRRGALYPQGIALRVHRPAAVHAPDRAISGVRRSRFRTEDGAGAPALAGASGQARVSRPRKLGFHEVDRNSYVWDKVADDPEYRDLWQRIWRDGFEPSPEDPTPAEAAEDRREQIARAARVVALLQARGVKVLFVRMPSSGEYLAFENREFPRARTWTALLAATGAPGIHFEDYPELQNYQLPDW